MCVTRLRTGGYLTGGPTFINDMAAALNLGNGSSAIMAMGGMLVSLAEQYALKLKGSRRVLAALSVSVLLFLAAALSHKFWIISKNLGTLPWCLYVSALSVSVYTLLRSMETFGRLSWFHPLRCSGLATLTVYMVPYVLYSIGGFLGIGHIHWLEGPLGLVKCALFSMLCLVITTVMVRCGCKLKI